MTPKSLLHAGALLAGMLSPAGSAAAQTLDVELNKLEDVEGRCAASLLLTNHMSETLDEVRFDVYVFGQDGVIVRRLLLDTGPMRVGKTTVATFALLDRPCSTIGRLLVSDVPLCRTANGADIDCAAALNATSRAAVPLVK
jgi:hypothetical protein